MLLAVIYAFAMATVAAYEGVTVTWEPDEVRRGLADATERCADISFDGLEEGSIVRSLTLGSGIDGSESIGGYVGVYGYRGLQKRNIDTPGYPSSRPGLNRAMIFDSACGDPEKITKTNPLGCAGEDPDLATGPGSLVEQELHEILIVTEDGDSEDPDDAGQGGALVFDFSNFGPDGVKSGEGTASVAEVYIMDGEEGGIIYCEDEDGEKIANEDGDVDIVIPAIRRNDGLLSIYQLGFDGCTRFIVDFTGSGAVDLTHICVPLKMTGDPMIIGPSGAKTQFWMPLGKFYPVFATPDGTEIFLRSFGKPGTHSQWIDGIVIKENGVITADVVVVHGLPAQRRRDGKFLNFVSVNVDGKQTDESGLHNSKNGTASVKLAKNKFPILEMLGDSIVIATKAFKLELFTMPARKFKDELEAAKYTHLDFKFLSIKDPANCTGFLCDVLFGTDTADPKLKAQWLTRPGAPQEQNADSDIETPEELAGQTNVLFS